MNQRQKKLTAILHDSSTELGQLIQKVSQLNDLEQRFQSFLSEDLQSHVRLGTYQKGTLVLLTDSGSWATKLRFEVPDLTQKLRKEPKWGGLVRIEIKVAPHLHHQNAIESTLAPKEDTTPPPFIPIPAQAQAIMQDLEARLDDCVENKALKKALRRLIRKT